MEVTQLSLLKLALVGKKVKHRNRYGREVTLEVEDVSVESGSRDLEPATRENDWWPASENWEHHHLHFVDGSKLQFTPNTKFDIVE
jgi:hypothetical protein